MKRWFSVLLALVLLVSTLPISSIAEDTNSGAQEVTTITAEAADTEAAQTDAPVTDAPVTDAPVTDAPVTEAPVTEAPVTEAPVTEAPVTEAPVTEAPVTDAPSTQATATATVSAAVALQAPVALSATPDVPQYLTATPASTTSLYIHWQEVSAGTGYSLEMSTTKTFTSASTTVKAISGITTDNYTWSSLTCGTEYWFRIRAVDSTASPVAYSGYSDRASSIPSPSAPSTFTATAASATSVKLAWSKVSGVTGYYLKRDDTLIATLGASTLAYTDSSLVCGTEYTYTIYSYLSTVTSKNFNSLIYTAKPPVPTSFTATSLDTDTIKISWKAISDVSGYALYRSRSGASGTFDLLTTVTSPSTITYTDTNSGLAAGSTYYYYIMSYVTLTGGDLFSEASSTISCMPIPPTPTTFKGKSLTDSVIRVYWSKVEKATAYNVYCSDSKTGTYDKIGSRITALQFTNTGLTVGKPYYYYVKALVLLGDDTEIEGKQTSIIQVVPLPAAPATITLSNARFDRIQLDWTASLGATGYLIYRSTSTDGTYTLIKDVTTLTYLNGGLACGTVYYYKIRAYLTQTDGTIYYGPYSTVVYMKSTLPASTSAACSQVSSTSIDITWDAIAYAQGYYINVSTNGGALAYSGTVTDPTQLYFRATGLTPGNTYRFKVYGIRYVNGAPIYGTGVYTNSLLLLPTQPTGMKTTSINGSSLQLSWTQVNGVTGYLVQGSSTDDPDYTLTQTVASPTITVTDLKTGSNYDFTVTAYVTTDSGNQYGPVSDVYTTGAKPLPPTTVTATSKTSTSVALSWTQVTEATGYLLCRLDPGAPKYLPLYYVTANDVLTYVDSDSLQVGLAYKYCILSYVDVNGTKIFSNKSPVVTVTPVHDAPIVTAKSIDTKNIELTWTALTAATGYQVLVYDSATRTYSPMTTTTNTSITISNRTPGQGLYYKVRGYVENGGLRIFGKMSAAVLQASGVVAPDGLRTKTSTLRAKQARLYWNAVSGAAGYYIYISDSSSGPYSLVGTTASNSSVAYTCAGLVTGKTYYFKVAGYCVYNGAQCVGDLSDALEVTTVVEAVTNFSYTATSITSVNLKWTATSGADGYCIYASTTAGGTYTLLATAAAGAVSYPINDMTLRTSRYFMIRAFGYGVGGVQVFGLYSAELEAKSNVLAPTNLTLAGASTTKLKVTWTSSAGADGYAFYIAPKGSSSYTRVDILQDTEIQSYVFTGLSTKTTYNLLVKAFYVNSSGTVVGGGNAKLTATTK